MRITLKALRVNYGFTQSQMAEIVGVTGTAWANYENCRTVPNNDVVQRIVKIFHVNYDDLIFSRYVQFNSTKLYA